MNTTHNYKNAKTLYFQMFFRAIFCLSGCTTLLAHVLPFAKYSTIITEFVNLKFIFLKIIK